MRGFSSLAWPGTIIGPIVAVDRRILSLTDRVAFARSMAMLPLLPVSERVILDSLPELARLARNGDQPRFHFEARANCDTACAFDDATLSS